MMVVLEGSEGSLYPPFAPEGQMDAKKLSSRKLVHSLWAVVTAAVVCLIANVSQKSFVQGCEVGCGLIGCSTDHLDQTQHFLFASECIYTWNCPVCVTNNVCTQATKKNTFRFAKGTVECAPVLGIENKGRECEAEDDELNPYICCFGCKAEGT
jgi:hypothetical protein